jgi:hypothetical protein
MVDPDRPQIIQQIKEAICMLDKKGKNTGAFIIFDICFCE